MASTIELLLLANQPTPWMAITSFGSGWTSTTQAYCRINNGNVELQGNLVNTSAANAQVMATLPSVCWPPSARAFPCACTTTTSLAMFEINTNGTMVIYDVPTGGHTFVLDGTIYALLT